MRALRPELASYPREADSAVLPPSCERSVLGIRTAIPSSVGRAAAALFHSRAAAGTP